MKQIPLTNSRLLVKVSDSDFERLDLLGPWFLNKSGYVQRTKTDEEIQDFVLGYCEGFRVDHFDRDKLNNQKENLSFVTRSQNRANSKLNKNNKSGYRGVYYFAPTKKYQAAIRKDGHVKHLGYFVSAEDAAREYDKHAKILHGVFATLNFP